MSLPMPPVYEFTGQEVVNMLILSVSTIPLTTVSRSFLLYKKAFCFACFEQISLQPPPTSSTVRFGG